MERLNSEANDMSHALSLFKSYIAQMCDEYDRRNLSLSEAKKQAACAQFVRDNTILKKAVLIMDDRLKLAIKEDQKNKLELQSKDQ